MQGNDSGAPDGEPTRRWLAQFFGAIDRMDAAGFAAFFGPDGQFRFANHLPARGPEAIAAGASLIFERLDAIRHEVLKSWSTEGDLLVEGQVHYLRSADGKAFAFPFMSVFEFAGEPGDDIASYRVYVDSHELFEAPSP